MADIRSVRLADGHLSRSGPNEEIGTLRRLAKFVTADRLLWLLVALLVVSVAIVPLLYVIDAAFYRESRTGLTSERSLDAIVNVYFSAEYLGYLWETVVLSTIVTALSLVAGVTMALLIARTDFPWKGPFEFLIITPLFLSPFTGLIAWVSLGAEKSGFVNGVLSAVLAAIGLSPTAIVNINTYGGIVWIMFLFFCPFAFLFTVGTLRTMDASLEEAARTTGATPMETLRKVTLPLSTPSIFGSGLLIFVLSAELYTVPGMIGSHIGLTTLPWKIYRDSTGFPIHLAHAAAAGTLLLWVTAGGIWLQRRITRRAERFVTVSGKGFRTRPLPLGSLKVVAVAAVCIYVASAVVLPFAALILSSFMRYSSATVNSDVLTLKHYKDLIQTPSIGLAFWNTVWLGLASGVVCVALGALVSFMELRSRGFSAKLISFLAVLPIAVPGLVYGVGLLWLFVKTPFYGSSLVLLLAFVAKFLPYGVVVSRSGLMQINPELEQCARVSGATGLVALRKITLPLLKPTLIAIMFFVMLGSMKELSASVLLYSQRSLVLSVVTWVYMDNGSIQFACAVAVIQTIVMAALIFLARRLFGVKVERTFGRASAA